MPKLPILSGQEIIKILQRKGFIHVRTKGSHAILVKETEKDKITIPVPLHKELAKGTLLSILKQAGMTKEELY
ncbi:MAG: type II toxin-antitoxin system HicA family toxin [bacterium]|nr:type II toxin-antitoxin system HicA family toxin [bacterium]